MAKVKQGDRQTMVAATSPPSFLSSQFLGATFSHSSPPTAAASPSTSRVGFRSPRIAASASAYTSSPRYEYDTPRLAQSTATGGASLYEVLELPVGASCQEIKVAYRRLARLCHPDVRKDTSAEEFMKIHAAYATLSDPEKRADYDLRLLRRITPSAARMTTPFTGCTRRTWETDQCW